MKKAFILILSVAMLLSCFIPVCASAEEPTAISTREQFEAITSTGNYYLTDDIDFEGKVYSTYVAPCEDDANKQFKGTLDGRGHTIHNFSISTSEATGGIFKDTANATITNLNIGTQSNPVSITGAATTTAVGTISSAAYGPNVSNVTVWANISVTGVTSSGGSYGGFFGTHNNINVTNCVMNGSVSVSTTANDIFAGGFSGKTQRQWPYYTNCINNADVTVVSCARTGYVGGIVAFATTANSYTPTMTFTGCINNGTLDTSGAKRMNRCGGIVGDNQGHQNTVITNCFNFGTLNGRTTANANNGVGGMIGYASTAVSITGCANYGTFNAATDDCGAIYGNGAGTITASNNFDRSGTLDVGDVSASVKVKGVQYTAVNEHYKATPEAEETSVFDIRFVGTVDSLEYAKVGFLVEVYYTADGEVQNRSVPVECKHVYDSIYATVGETAEEIDVTDLGETAGEAYIVALSVNAVPATAAAGTVTFIFRAFAEDAEGEAIYGNAAMYAFQAGSLVFSSAVPCSL